MRTENTLPMYENSAASLHCGFGVSPRTTFSLERCGLIAIYLNFFQKFLQCAFGFLELRVDSYHMSQTSPFSVGYTAPLASCKPL